MTGCCVSSSCVRFSLTSRTFSLAQADFTFAPQLESIAGVPGFTAAMLRHLRSLRLMRRDGGASNLALSPSSPSSKLTWARSQDGSTACCRRQRTSAVRPTSVSLLQRNRTLTLDRLAVVRRPLGPSLALALQN